MSKDHNYLVVERPVAIGMQPDKGGIALFDPSMGLGHPEKKTFMFPLDSVILWEPREELVNDYIQSTTGIQMANVIPGKA